MTDLLTFDSAFPDPPRRDAACQPEKLAPHTDASETGRRRRPEQHPPTGPTTSLSVGLKKPTALSRTQKHGSLLRP